MKWLRHPLKSLKDLFAPGTIFGLVQEELRDAQAARIKHLSNVLYGQSMAEYNSNRICLLVEEAQAALHIQQQLTVPKAVAQEARVEAAEIWAERNLWKSAKLEQAHKPTSAVGKANADEPKDQPNSGRAAAFESGAM